MVAASVAREHESVRAKPLSADELRRIHARWRACNYLAVKTIQAGP